MKRTPLKRRSDKQAKRMAILKRDYDDVFSTHPRCGFCGTPGATSPHHHTCKGRSGDGLYWWFPAHESCHMDAHQKPWFMKQARLRGLLDCKWEDRDKAVHPIILERNKIRGI